MKNHQFEAVLESRIMKIRDVLKSKAKEYAVGDRMYNFKRAAEIGRTTPEKALIGMFLKHLVSVLDMVEGNIVATPYLVEEKIGDAINYLILLEAMMVENLLTPSEEE